jgi:DNA-binding response OmpR family regulator
MIRILVIDDDLAFLSGLSQLLTTSAYEVRSAASGTAGLIALAWQPELIILDPVLPDIDGFAVCKYIRQMSNSYIPILMLTAHDSLEDKIKGLDIGADEYVTKPFEPAELLSRIRAMLRFAENNRLMSRATMKEQPLVFGPLKIWRIAHQIEIDNQRVELTPTEWTLLELFIEHPGQVLRRETMLNKVWGIHYAGESRTIDTHVQRLRAKLETNPDTLSFIHTVRGFGYRFSYIDI